MVHPVLEECLELLERFGIVRQEEHDLANDVLLISSNVLLVEDIHL